MSTPWPCVINLVNTAFGVTVLAVPYCFHQCGIILGGILLVISSYATKRSCNLLLRSAQISRKRDFESLGFHVNGFLGKFVIEMSLIGYLVGTAIAWFVIIGDVAPAVISSLTGIEKSWGLRMLLIISIGLGVILPLSLVKDITSLSSASNIAIAIYTLFVLQLFFSTLPKILSGDWMNAVNFWKPDGVLQCLPIFGISFLCQTVLFVLYEALPEPSVKKMEHVVSTAMDIVLLLSTTVGFCGYVMYFDDGIQGDLLNNYKHDFISEFIRLGFCISTILSFPLLVFPCRASINSMISSAKMISVEGTPAGGTYIPHDRFFVITCSLIAGTVVFGVLFPNVEFVMALVGATMGAMLTFILPAYIFLKVAGEDLSKTEAKVLLVLGLCLFCLSTFSVLSMSESHEQLVLQPVADVKNLPNKISNASLRTTEEIVKVELQLPVDRPEGNRSIEKKDENLNENKVDDRKRVEVKDVKNEEVREAAGEIRKEPVLPQERRVLMNAEKIEEETGGKNDEGVDQAERGDVEDMKPKVVQKRDAEPDVNNVARPNGAAVKSTVSNTNASLVPVSDEKGQVVDNPKLQLTLEEGKNRTSEKQVDQVEAKLDGGADGDVVPAGEGGAGNANEPRIAPNVKRSQVLRKYLLDRSKLRLRRIRASKYLHSET